ncbi:unnamed protein product [marine sediment metagenome]|uniref:Uncharacterized protein n=1 Tax=marine sediment metagenome TaxID=412755 RepID=X1NSR0_9ZZZZ
MLPPTRAVAERPVGAGGAVLYRVRVMLLVAELLAASVAVTGTEYEPSLLPLTALIR